MVTPVADFFSVRGSKLRVRTRARRWIHSPKKGNGHTAHQRREAKGTMTLIRTNHHRIQTKTMMMFRLPTGVPKIPAARKRTNKIKFGSTTANWNHRCLTSHASGGMSWSTSISDARRPAAAIGVHATEGAGSSSGFDAALLIVLLLLGAH